MERVSSSPPQRSRWEATLGHHNHIWMPLALAAMLAACAGNGSPGFFYAPNNSGLQSYGDMNSQFGLDAGANDFAPLSDANNEIGRAHV